MGAPLCWCLELGWEAVDSRHEISCVYIRMEKEILPLCNMQCYCDMLGHDLVPKDTPAHILQTQSVACTMPQHCKFLVLLLKTEEDSDLWWQLRISALGDLWRGQRKFYFSPFLGSHIMFASLTGGRPAHSQFYVLIMLLKWGGLTSGQRMLWQKSSEMKTLPGLCSRGHMQKAVTDQNWDIWNICPQPTWCINTIDVPALPGQGRPGAKTSGTRWGSLSPSSISPMLEGNRIKLQRSVWQTWASLLVSC